MIKKIPNHCNGYTVSFSKVKAIITETGSSRAETILPNPIPVSGNPAFNSIGGIIVPKRAMIIPHFAKISKLKGVTCVNKAKVNTITAPPRIIYKLRCVEEMVVATLFAVNIVVVKEEAASKPNRSPNGQLILESLKSILKMFIANAVPINTINTEIIFCKEGAFLSKNHSSKTPIQTVCINNTIPIETGMYFTAK